MPFNAQFLRHAGVTASKPPPGFIKGGIGFRIVRDVPGRNASKFFQPEIDARLEPDDLAVALEPHVGHLAARERVDAEPALADVVRTAWLLDQVGDSGNADEIGRAFTAFDAAVSRLLAAFEPVP